MWSHLLSLRLSMIRDFLVMRTFWCPLWKLGTIHSYKKAQHWLWRLFTHNQMNLSRSVSFKGLLPTLFIECFQIKSLPQEMEEVDKTSHTSELSVQLLKLWARLVCAHYGLEVSWRILERGKAISVFLSWAAGIKGHLFFSFPYLSLLR